MSRFRTLIRAVLVYPLWVTTEVFIGVFDFLISRYLVAAVIVFPVLLPVALVAPVIGQRVLLATWLTLGVLLTGLWEGCRIFTIRGYLVRRG